MEVTFYHPTCEPTRIPLSELERGFKLSSFRQDSSLWTSCRFFVSHSAIIAVISYLKGEPCDNNDLKSFVRAIISSDINSMDIDSLGIGLALTLKCWWLPVLKIVCDDGVVEKLSLVGLANRFHYFEALLDQDPNIREYKMNYTVSALSYVLNSDQLSWVGDMREVLEVANLLTPKSNIYYLGYDIDQVTVPVMKKLLEEVPMEDKLRYLNTLAVLIRSISHMVNYVSMGIICADDVLLLTYYGRNLTVITYLMTLFPSLVADYILSMSDCTDEMGRLILNTKYFDSYSYGFTTRETKERIYNWYMSAVKKYKNPSEIAQYTKNAPFGLVLSSSDMARLTN